MLVAWLLSDESLDGKPVGIHAETADRALAGTADERAMAEFFALIDVGDVYFDDGCLQRPYAVVQSYRSVCVGSGIDNDAVGCSESLFLHTVDELPLDVALVVGEGYFGISPAEAVEKGFHRLAAIDAWLALSEQVQVGSVDDFYLHDGAVFAMIFADAALPACRICAASA